MAAHVCSGRNTVNGLRNAVYTHVDEFHAESGIMSLSHLIESDCAAQSGFGCEVVAGANVILNERFADRCYDRTNRPGNTDVRTAVELSRMVVCVEVITAEPTSRKRARLSTAGRSGNYVHGRHPLSP